MDETTIFNNLATANFEGQKRVFDGCEFLNSDLSYANLFQSTFIDCRFENCNLSLVKIASTGFQNVVFEGCKLSGVNFGHANTFGFSVSFHKCLLEYAVFYNTNLKGTNFTDCILTEADFTEANLTVACFNQCDLSRAIFMHSNLSNANFTSAYNFDIDPENNTLTKARFSADSLAGLLGKYRLIIE